MQKLVSSLEENYSIYYRSSSIKYITYLHTHESGSGQLVTSLQLNIVEKNMYLYLNVFPQKIWANIQIYKKTTNLS